MSLDIEEPEQEQNEMKELQKQLVETTSLVKTLSHQLGELRDKVSKKYFIHVYCSEWTKLFKINCFVISR